MKSYKIWMIAIGGVLLLMAMTDLALGQCSQRGRTIAETTVYDRQPEFSTGQGWRLGQVLAILPPNTPVTICDSVQIGVLYDKKLWYRIQFGGPRDGWAFSGQLQIASGSQGAWRAPWSLVAVAHAAGEPGLPGTGLPSNTMLIVYLIMFVFVMSGMLGKVAFDAINAGEGLTLRQCLSAKNFFRTVIVAPIVFLTFLNTADFSSGNGELGLLIMACLAFQNGFFWQTVLPAKGTQKTGATVKVDDP